MLRVLLLIGLLFAPVLPVADTVVAARNLRAHSQITAQDVLLKPGDISGAHGDLAQVLGLETRVAIYAGRPVRQGDVGPAAVVERNQVVPLRYRRAGLVIEAEGRALSRAGPGDWIRVMNLASRQTISGQVMADGSVQLSD